MNYNDHNPPHFHARYAGLTAVYGIGPVALLAGGLHPRAAAMVEEWARVHQAELRADGERARQTVPLNPIPGLE